MICSFFGNKNKAEGKFERLPPPYRNVSAPATIVRTVVALTVSYIIIIAQKNNLGSNHAAMLSDDAIHKHENLENVSTKNSFVFCCML